MGNIQNVSCGKALLFTKRENAKRKILLGGHMDTVFEKASPFQKVTKADDGHLIGPGIIDMKGGLMVMLAALCAFEKSAAAKNLGWQVLITPDEEVGSPSSAPLWVKLAKTNPVALIFEPSLPDGSLIDRSKGSAIFV